MYTDIRVIFYTHIYIYKSKRGGAGWLKRITEESGFDVWLDLRWTRTRTDSTRNSKSLWTPASSPLLFDRNFRDGGGRRPFVTRRPIVRRRCVFSNFKDVRFVIRETNFPVSRHPRNRRRSYENSLHPKKKGRKGGSLVDLDAGRPRVSRTFSPARLRVIPGIVQSVSSMPNSRSFVSLHARTVSSPRLARGS